MDEKRALDDAAMKQVSGGSYEKDGYRYYEVFGVDENLCTACELCGTVCPADCISFTPYAKIDLNYCVYCGCCEGECPVCAIGWKTFSEKIGE